MTDLVAQLVGALEGATRELESVLEAINDDRTPHDGDEFHERLQAARAALTAAKAGGWLPIETAPEGTMILCANMNAREARDWCFVAWMAGGKVCGHRMDKPTHWQHLPNPPKEQNT